MSVFEDRPLSVVAPAASRLVGYNEDREVVWEMEFDRSATPEEEQLLARKYPWIVAFEGGISRATDPANADSFFASLARQSR